MSFHLSTLLLLQRRTAMWVAQAQCMLDCSFPGLLSISLEKRVMRAMWDPFQKVLGTHCTETNQDKVKKKIYIFMFWQKICYATYKGTISPCTTMLEITVNKKQESYFPRAKHSSLTDEPFAAYVVSGKRASIFGSYSPITPVEHQNS